MDSLSEGASVAQNGHDHLWHARALEYLLLCMLIQARFRVTFTIPQVCRSLPNRRGSTQLEITPKTGESLKLLAQLLPPMVENILELYARVANLDLGGSLQDVLRECRIRLVNMLTFVKSEGGLLNMRSLGRIIGNGGTGLTSKDSTAGEPVAISRAGLANILVETLQEAQSSRSMLHYISILVAVTSSLATLGLDRKYAFYIKQLLQQFVPKIIEARKLGASEAGVHPAAGLPPISAALQGIIPEMVSGTRTMLNLAAAAYGVPLSDVPEPGQRIPNDVNVINAKLRAWVTEHNAEDRVLKLDLLRACVSVCEALPDVAAGLHFSSNILRTAKQVVTMPPYPLTENRPVIASEDQARLLESIKRAVGAAGKLGVEGCRAEYWDDFLVRDVHVFERDSLSKLIAHKPSDLAIRGSGLVETVRDPFIYNPFSKDKSVVPAPVLVAGELSSFAILLQNPLEVEVEIDEIRLFTTGCTFRPEVHSIVLGPMSAQLFTMTGTPLQSGDLEIQGCTALVRNCYEQDFFTFREDWKAPIVTKQRMTGKTRLKKLAPLGTSPTTVDLTFKPPVPAPLKLKVIDSQPRLVAKSNSLTSRAVMLIEGERRLFDLVLINESQAVAADLVLITTEDSVSDRLKEALAAQDLNPAEKYELQDQLALRPAIEVKEGHDIDSKKVLAGGKSMEYSVAVYGRPGLVSATVQADFAYLGIPSAEVKDTFYTRQVRFPISVTVNGSIEIPRCNVLPIHSDFSWSSDDRSDQNSSLTTTSSVLKASEWLKGRHDASQYCMLTLDLRNVWPQPLLIELKASNHPGDDSGGDGGGDDVYTVNETLQPGHANRIILLVRRLFVQDSHAPIPNLETQKQFVVIASKLSAEAEAASRESFWYRQELLKCLRGTWREEGSGRYGDIDLRKGVRLSPRMVDALRVEHVEIEYALRTNEQISEPTIKQVGRFHFTVQTETFATLSTTIHNHTQTPLRLILRLQPALRHQPHNIALDLSKRLAWTGVLQRAVHPAIEPGGTFVADLGIIALVDGEYEINASVEEIVGRRSAGTNSTERRIWHARSPCIIDAEDLR
jgi:trafficking protein particle complex subunit 9